MFSKEVLVSVLGGLLRMLGAGLSLWLVEKGIATPEQVELAIVGLAGFIGAVIWMWMNKAKARVELLTGLTAQPGTTVNELKDQIKAGVAVPASTSNDATPRAVTDIGSVKPPSAPAWLLPLLLAGTVTAGAAACGGGKQVNTPEDAQRVEQQRIEQLRLRADALADVVNSGGDFVVKLVRTADVAHKSGAITRAERDVILRAVSDLEPKAVAFIELARRVTTDAELRGATAAFLDLIGPALKLAAGSGHSGLAAVASDLSNAYRKLREYLGLSDPDWLLAAGGAR